MKTLKSFGEKGKTDSLHLRFARIQVFSGGGEPLAGDTKLKFSIEIAIENLELSDSQATSKIAGRRAASQKNYFPVFAASTVRQVE